MTTPNAQLCLPGQGNEIDFVGGIVDLSLGVVSSISVQQSDLNRGLKWTLSARDFATYFQVGQPSELAANKGRFVYALPNTKIVYRAVLGEAVKASVTLAGDGTAPSTTTAIPCAQLALPAAPGTKEIDFVGAIQTLSLGTNSTVVVQQGDLNRGLEWHLSSGYYGVYFQVGLPAELNANTGRFFYALPYTRIVYPAKIGEAVKASFTPAGDNTPPTISALQATSIGALAIANNLSDVADAPTSRTNLGLGTAAVQTNAFFAQTANNLSDLASVTTARLNLGFPVLTAATVYGSVAGGAPQALTPGQLTLMINTFTSTLGGAAPASGGGTVNFLRADGTWQPPSSAGVSSIGGNTGAFTVSSGLSLVVNDLRMSTMATGKVLGNISGGAAVPAAVSVPVLLNTITSVLATAAFTTASPNITMATNPGDVVPGMNVYDVTNSQQIGTVLTYVGTALVLAANAAHASSGAADQLVFATSATNTGYNDLTSFTSAYSAYELLFENMIPVVTSTTLELQVHSGGSFQATGYLSTVWNVTTSGGAANPTTFIGLSFTGAVLTGTAGFSGRITVFRPSGTTSPKSWTGHGVYSVTANASLVSLAALWNSNGALDGFQTLFSGASPIPASGTVKVYGLP